MTDTGKVAAFTSQAEFEKGQKSQALSNFIDTTLKACLDFESEGVVINPWGQSFMLDKSMIERIFQADGGEEYFVSDAPVTQEILEDGSYLRHALQICNRNRTTMNLIRLARILRDSWIWIPCNVIMKDDDYQDLEKVILEADEKGSLDSLIGQEIRNHGPVRMAPDILQNGEEYFFPVFTSEDEMGEYGQVFSRMQRHFLDALHLALNNEKDVSGIVINAFTEPFIVPKEMLISGEDSGRP